MKRYLAVLVFALTMFSTSLAMALDITPLPEPSTLFLLGLGVAGLLGVARKRKRR